MAPPLFVTPAMDINSPALETTTFPTTMFFQPFCSLVRTLEVLLMNTLEVPRSCVNPRVVLLKMSELGFGELTPSIVLFPGLFLHVLVNKLDVPPPPGQPLLL